LAESKKRIGLYGSGDVPRSRRIRSKTAGPESLGLKDIRQVPPIRRVKPSGIRGKAIAASAIVALVAVFIAISAVALAPSVKTDSSAGTEQAPPTPFPVAGRTYDIAGAPVGGVLVTITNERLGLSGTTVSDTGVPDPTGLGFYIFDLSTLGQAQSGDIIRIDAVSTTNTGTNSTPVPTPMGGFMYLNVTLNAAIPEFQDMLMPAVGMVGAFLIMTLVAKTRND
jgi:hypothetical protein